MLSRLSVLSRYTGSYFAREASRVAIPRTSSLLLASLPPPAVYPSRLFSTSPWWLQDVRQDDHAMFDRVMGSQYSAQSQTPRRAREVETATPPTNRIYVGGITEANRGDIMAFLETLPDVVSTPQKTLPDGRPRNFIFVTFRRQQTASSALGLLRERFENENLRFDYAEGQKAQTLFIGGIQSPEHRKKVLEAAQRLPGFTQFLDPPRRDGSFKAFFHASFSDPVLASDAREILESQFKDNGIRIDYALDSKPTPSQEPPAVEDITPCADLYIGNLPFDATETDMMAALDDVKGFQELYISRDSYGRNKGSARATFDSVHHASEALNILDGRTVMDRPMRVNYSNRRSTRPSGPATPLLFIGGLPRNVTEQMVHDALAGFDGLKGIEIFNLTNREKSPFAHARYETADQAKLVIQACHWKPLFAGGPPMRIDFHYEKKPVFTGQPDAHPPSPVLFVGGIGDRSVKDLLELFASFSPVSARAVMADHSGRPRGFGYVTFSTIDHAAKAMQSMAGKNLGDGHSFRVNYAAPETERKASYNARAAREGIVRRPNHEARRPYSKTEHRGTRRDTKARNESW